jgi:ubiquinone/menaquinone biosynthesis C-methylase UbiE
MRSREPLPDMETEILASEYFGFVAATYVKHRVGPKWWSENAAVETLLDSVPEGASVLDAPVGTGRFFPLYLSRRLTVSGIDVSRDMLEQAAGFAEEVGATVALAEGDIRALPFPNSNFDLVLCVRFLNLAGEAVMAEALKELARVSRKSVLIGIRYLTPYSELGMSPFDLLRRAMRLLGLPRFRSRRWGLTNYRKGNVEAAIRGAGLLPISSHHVERRWDGTDYVFFHLHKLEPVSSRNF